MNIMSMYIEDVEFSYLFDYFPYKYFSTDKKIASFRTSLFEDRIAKMINEYKETGKYDSFFSDLLIDKIKSTFSLSSKNTIFIPVPCSNTSKYKIRYENICRIVSETLQIENGYNYINLQNDCLEAKFGDRSRKDYKKSLILTKPKEIFTGKNIIIFDDIITTGHTLRIVRDFLENYKIYDVQIISLAKTYDSSIRGKYEYYLNKYNQRENLSINELRKIGNSSILKQLLRYLRDGSPHEKKECADIITEISFSSLGDCLELRELLIDNLKSNFLVVREASLNALLKFNLSSYEIKKIKVIEKEKLESNYMENDKIFVRKSFRNIFSKKFNYQFLTPSNFSLKGVIPPLAKHILNNNLQTIADVIYKVKDINIPFKVELENKKFNFYYEKISYLGLAVIQDNLDISKILINSKADVNFRIICNMGGEKIESTLLLEAIKNNNIEMVKLLLEYGADPNDYIIHDIDPGIVAIGCVALEQAIRQGNLKTIELLKAYGLNIHKSIREFSSKLSNRDDINFTFDSVHFTCEEIYSLSAKYGDEKLTKLLKEMSAYS